jgi:hypothetical protein
MDLRLVIKIPEAKLTINGLIKGLKEGSMEIYGGILSTLMQALEERKIEGLLERDLERYRRNGRQSKPRQLKCSLGTIPYRFAQLVDREKGRTFMPLVEALSIPAHDHYLEEAMEPFLGLALHVSFRSSHE